MAEKTEKASIKEEYFAQWWLLWFLRILWNGLWDGEWNWCDSWRNHGCNYWHCGFNFSSFP